MLSCTSKFKITFEDHRVRRRRKQQQQNNFLMCVGTAPKMSFDLIKTSERIIQYKFILRKKK